MGGALPVKYSEYFGAKRRESFKNENIRYDSYAMKSLMGKYPEQLSKLLMGFSLADCLAFLKRV
jgi:hypothetical protein